MGAVASAATGATTGATAGATAGATTGVARAPAAAAGPPGPAELANPRAAKAWQQAQAFEAMAIGQFLAPMFNTVDTASGFAGGGEAEEAWRPMLTDEIAKAVAKAGGLGLAVPVYRQMLRLLEDPT